jgi:hypothetical protein
MLLPALAHAEPAGTPAARLPGGAVAAAEWQGMGEACGGLLDLTEAILLAPLVGSGMGSDAGEMQALIDFVRAGLQHPGALALTPKAAGQPPVLDAVIAAGDASAALAEKLSAIVTHSGVSVEKRAEGAATLYMASEPPLQWIAADDCLLISTDAVSLTGLRSPGGAGRLTESAAYVAARATLPVSPDGWRLAAHIHLGDVLKLAAEDDPDAAEVLRVFGMGEFESLCLVVDEDSYGVRCRGYVGIPEGEGVFAKLYRC